MDSSTFPDWRRIGRRLGKKLRDGLNPHPVAPGPSPEERRAQRLRDGFKGFVYFDTFEEVEAWDSENVDPIQQPNQPLLFRSAGNVPNEHGPKTKLILCHDYQGGYHDYDGVRPDLLDFEMYSCRYLQFVDMFIYFSHKLVCVPPPTWTNCLHRNGVRALGTLLIEPQTPNLERLLTRKDGVFIVARQLADITGIYGFDGWLINVEQDAPETYMNWSHLLIDFILQLRKFLGVHRKVLWYDALTTDGDVYYQNGLTPLNRPYAEAADGLFTNYKWNDKKLADSKLLAIEAAIPTENVFFGIDLWAQNTNNNMPGPPRVTYPPKGGGGTNTGLAMNTLTQNGFSTAMFAPAWAFEHFPISSSAGGSSRGPSVAHQVDESLWTGASLLDELLCDCHGRKPHHTNHYKSNAITRFAQEYPAGSSTFFETGFNQAFLEQPQTNQLLPELSSQDPLPNVIPVSIQDWEAIHQGPMTRVLYGKLDSTHQAADYVPSLTIFTKLVGSWEEGGDQSINYGTRERTPIQRLCLYELNMPADDSLEATIEARIMRHDTQIRTGFYLAYQVPGEQRLEHAHYTMSPPMFRLEPLIKLPIHMSNRRLVELGAFVESGPEHSLPIALLEIDSIVIKPRKAMTLEDLEAAFTIEDIRQVKEVKESQVEKRIAWRWATKPGQREQVWPVEMPWSQTTGPFSSFTVHVGGGKTIIKAFSTQFSFKPKEIEDLDETVVVQVVGNLFGGGHVRSALFSLHKTDLINHMNE
ncbi:MAG: hypothetical protein Q9172_003439 [Xanthocarpia lactea]